MRQIKAVFWDVDGTLADTEMSGHRVAFNLAFSEANLGWVWDYSSYINLLRIQGGKNRIASYASSNGYSLSQSKAEELHIRKQFFYDQLIANGSVKLRTGVQRLVNELTSNGVKQWLITSSGKEAVYSLLNSSFSSKPSPFSGTIAYEDVINHKPSPDPYFKGIDKSGFSPMDILVIEDSPAGFDSARSAKLNCLITLSPWATDFSNQFMNAAAVINHLGDIGDPCNVLNGPTCQQNMVTLEYLQLLIN